MSIEAGLLGPAAILVLTPPRQGDQQRSAAAAVLFADSTRRVIAVESR